VLAGWLYHFHINLPYFFGAGILLVGVLIALPAFRRPPMPAQIPEPEAGRLALSATARSALAQMPYSSSEK